MRRTKLGLVVMLTGALLLSTGGAARAGVPGWAKPAVDYLVKHDYIERDSFKANRPMTKRAFKRLMHKAFGRGFNKKRGYVKAAQVDAALVRVLGKRSVARRLKRAHSPDGWEPEVGYRFGTEVVAREMGLRHDRPTSEERYEASARRRMRQADVAYAVWRAKTDPSTWGADVLRDFKLANYSRKLRKVVEFALSQVGRPYVYGGEWHRKTASGYPYGGQARGGFDCSGLVWFVLRQRASGWDPPGRPYRGWSLKQRSSSDMARHTPKKIRYQNLKPGDVLFFASNGRHSSAGSVYHAGIYLGRGWMAHSSGSRAGVSIGDVRSGSWWRGEFAWGRRVIR